jgi:hypothetical protein
MQDEADLNQDHACRTQAGDTGVYAACEAPRYTFEEATLIHVDHVRQFANVWFAG